MHWIKHFHCTLNATFLLLTKAPLTLSRARSISDRSGLYTSWMLTFALFWDRSGIDPTWIASGSGLRSVQDRSTVFPAEWERKHVLKAILLSSLPSLRVVLQVAKKCLQKRRTVQTRALIAAWARRIHDKRDESHRNADVYAGIAKAVKKQGLSWTWLEAGWKYSPRNI